MTARAYIGVGANLGEPQQRIIVCEDFQTRIAFAHVASKEVKEELIVIDEQDLFHGALSDLHSIFNNYISKG